MGLRNAYIDRAFVFDKLTFESSNFSCTQVVVRVDLFGKSYFELLLL